MKLFGLAYASFVYTRIPWQDQITVTILFDLKMHPILINIINKMSYILLPVLIIII